MWGWILAVSCAVLIWAYLMPVFYKVAEIYRDERGPRPWVKRVHRHIRNVYKAHPDEFSNANEKRAHALVDKIEALDITDRESETIWCEAMQGNRHTFDILGIASIGEWKDMEQDAYVMASMLSEPRILIAFAHDPGFVAFCNELENSMDRDFVDNAAASGDPNKRARMLAVRDLLTMADRIHSKSKSD